MTNAEALYMEQRAIVNQEIQTLMKMIKTGKEKIPDIIDSTVERTLNLSTNSELGLGETLGNIRVDGNEFDSQAVFLGILAGGLLENGKDVVVRCPKFNESGTVISHTEIVVAPTKLLELMTTEAEALKVSPYLIGRQIYYTSTSLQDTWYGADPTSDQDKYYGDISVLLMQKCPSPPGL